MFSRSGYKDLLGTPKRLLLRLSGNILIISRGCNESIVGTLTRPSWSSIEMRFLSIFQNASLVIGYLRKPELVQKMDTSSSHLLKLWKFEKSGFEMGAMWYMMMWCFCLLWVVWYVCALEVDGKMVFQLTVLGEPWRGTKYFCFDIFPPLFRDPLCCGVLF